MELSMTIKVWRFLVLLPWVLLPVFIFGYVKVWTYLPPRLVVHFNSEGEPNGWMGRTAFLAMATILLLAQLSGFSLILLPQNSEPKSPVLLYVFYLTVSGVTAIFWNLLQYNLYGTPLRWLWVGLAMLAATLIPKVGIWLSSRHFLP